MQKLNQVKGDNIVGVVLLEVPEALTKGVIGLVLCSTQHSLSHSLGRKDRAAYLNLITGLCFPSRGVSFAVNTGKLDSFMCFSPPPSSLAAYRPVAKSSCGALARSSFTSMLASPMRSLALGLS